MDVFEADVVVRGSESLNPSQLFQTLITRELTTLQNSLKLSLQEESGLSPVCIEIPTSEQSTRNRRQNFFRRQSTVTSSMTARTRGYSKQLQEDDLFTFAQSFDYDTSDLAQYIEYIDGCDWDQTFQYNRFTPLFIKMCSDFFLHFIDCILPSI